MLIGVDRVRVVTDLTEAWQSAIARRDMRVVVVEGPTGIGKTAVVQALYEQWASLQLRPAYWPATLHAAEPPGIRRPVPTIMDGDAAVSRQVRAARIYPTKMAPAPGTRLEWFWWGLTAQIGKFAALDGDRQIEDHVRRIAEAVARGDRQLTRDLLVLAARTVGLGAGLPARFELLGALGVTLAAIADSSLDAYELVRSVREVARSRRSLLDAELRRRGGDVFSVTRLKEAKNLSGNSRAFA